MINDFYNIKQEFITPYELATSSNSIECRNFANTLKPSTLKHNLDERAIQLSSPSSSKFYGIIKSFVVIYFFLNSNPSACLSTTNFLKIEICFSE